MLVMDSWFFYLSLLSCLKQRWAKIFTTLQRTYFSCANVRSNSSLFGVWCMGGRVRDVTTDGTTLGGNTDWTVAAACVRAWWPCFPRRSVARVCAEIPARSSVGVPLSTVGTAESSPRVTLDNSGVGVVGQATLCKCAGLRGREHGQ